MTRRSDERIVGQIKDLGQTVQTQAAAVTHEVSAVGEATERQRAELAHLINESVASLRGDNTDLHRTLRDLKDEVHSATLEAQRLRADLEALRQATVQATETAQAAAEALNGMAQHHAVPDQADADTLADDGAAPSDGAGAGSEPPVGGPPPAEGADGPPPGRNINDLLARAAGIAYAEVLSHRDTWAFLVERVSRGEHFRLPGDVTERGDSIVEADLSGRSLVAVLEALLNVQADSTASLGTRHLAAVWYARIGDALLSLDNEENPTARGDRTSGGRSGPVIEIVIDDRHRAMDEPDEPAGPTQSGTAAA